jgi:hypothetical protein
VADKRVQSSRSSAKYLVSVLSRAPFSLKGIFVTVATELYLADVPMLYRQFADVVGAKHWTNRVAQCNAEIAGNEHLRRHLESENQVAFWLTHLATLDNRYGLDVPPHHFGHAALYQVLAMMAQILSLWRVYPSDEAARLVRRVHGAFKNPDDMRALRLELTCAAHLTRKGYKISWPEIDGDGTATFDLLVENMGLSGLEMECKAVSDNKGRKIHQREAIEFQSLLQPWLEALCQGGAQVGISIVLTLSKRLPKSPLARQRLVDEVIVSVFAGAEHSVLQNGTHVRVRFFDRSLLTDVDLENRSEVRKLIDSISGTSNRESMLGLLQGGAFVSTVQSSEGDEFKDAVLDTVKNAAKRQLTKSRAGFVLISVDGLEPEQLRSIGEDDRLGRPSKLHQIAQEFLRSANRTHVVGIGFVSRNGMRSTHRGIMDTGGAAYYFYNRASPFWHPDFERLFSA